MKKIPRPINGNKIFEALKDKGAIVMACNVRMTYEAVRGIIRAAKEMDAAVIFELARTESDLEGGYTGITPKEYYKRCVKASDEVGFDIWALHADHIGIKKGDEEDIKKTKELVKGQIDAGYTSFAIDASHLFNFQGKTVEEELADNIRCTTEVAKFIQQNKKGDFGLEVEVGEIGRTDAKGMILTKPEEAVAFIKALNRNGVFPQVIAVANGSTHGNVYDAEGNPIEQVSIDIERTKEIAKALRKNNLNVRIAQHGITGTPLNLIKEKFPHGDIVKGNVATYWQNLVYDIMKEKNPEFYKEIWKWVMEKYKEKNPGKNETEIFGKNSKKAIKVFKDKIENLSDDIKAAIEERAYEEAKKFFDAFNAEGSADIVRKSL